MRVPNNPIGRAVDVAAHGPDLARRAAALLPRAVGLLDAADRLVERFSVLLDGFERCEDQLLAVVERVNVSHHRVQAMLDIYEPVLKHSADTATYASERFGPAQVDSLIDLLENQAVLRKVEDVLPMLAGLGTVAPDLKELIAVSRGLNELMGSVPGLGKAKRRVDEELQDLQQEADDPQSPRQ